MMNIEQKIKDLETQLEALKAEINREKWPDVGASFHVSVDGGVYESTSYDNALKVDYLNQGKLFHTKEEAEKERDARETIAQYQRLGRRFIYGKHNQCLFAGFDQKGDLLLKTVYRESGATGLFDTYFDNKEDLISTIEQVSIEKLLSAAKWRILGE